MCENQAFSTILWGAEFTGPENSGPRKNKNWKSRAGRWSDQIEELPFED